MTRAMVLEHHPFRRLAHAGRRCSALLVAAVAALAGMIAPAFAQSGFSPAASNNVQVELIADRSTIAPGETLTLGLAQRIAPGWHTYWINPGDAGEAPDIAWSEDAGFSFGPFRWPVPKTYVTGAGEYAIVGHVYEHEVVLPFTITAPADLGLGQRVSLRGDAFWLV